MPICSRRRVRCSRPRRGSSCVAITSRAIARGQGWWRFLDPRPLVPDRDCNDRANDAIGDYSDPYAVPVSARRAVPGLRFVQGRCRAARRDRSDVQDLLRADAAGIRAWSPRVAEHSSLNHHPVLGFAPNPSVKPTGLYPGNELAAVGARADQRRAPVSGQRTGPVHRPHPPVRGCKLRLRRNRRS